MIILVMENTTVFHKIVSGELPAYTIAEDKDHLAILDIFPTHYAQVVVLPKRYAPSQFSMADPEILAELIKFSQQVAKQIERKLPDVKRCQVVIEGFEVDYLHIKLFPAINLPQDGVHRGGSIKLTEEELKAIHSKLV